MNFTSIISLFLRILILVKLNKASSSASSHHSLKKHPNEANSNFLLDKIIAETSYSNLNTNLINQQQLEFKKYVYLFIDRVAHTGTRSTCDTRLIQSDVQAKMRKLKSLISTCSGYCRLAISPEGAIYGGKDFNLDTIWNREDVSDELLAANSALLGAYYIKFILADKYFCINKNGELFSSTSQSKGCLWFNDWPRLIPAYYPSLNLVILKNCKLNVQTSTNQDNTELGLRNYNMIDECKNNFNVTSGFSPDLQKFFRTCQSNLIKQQDTTTTTKPHDPYLFKPIFMHTNPITRTTSTVSVPALPDRTRISFITKKTFQDNTNLNSILIEKAKLLCKDYLLDELIYKKLFNNYEYLYEASKSTNSIPKLCIDYIKQLNQTTGNEIKSEPIEYNYLPSYDESLLESIVDATNNKFKKCYSLRNTPLYKQCMEKYYKCHKFNNDIEKLKKCRKKYGITVPPKKINKYFI